MTLLVDLIDQEAQPHAYSNKIFSRQQATEDYAFALMQINLIIFMGGRNHHLLCTKPANMTQILPDISIPDTASLLYNEIYFI